MVAINTIPFALIFFSFFVIHIQADHVGSYITNLDPYWQARAKEAEVQNKQAYNQHPESVTDEFNINVGE